jgi:hypothetical protein
MTLMDRITTKDKKLDCSNLLSFANAHKRTFLRIVINQIMNTHRVRHTDLLLSIQTNGTNATPICFWFTEEPLSRSGFVYSFINRRAY